MHIHAHPVANAIAAIVVLARCVAPSPAAPATRPAAARPNIVFILADDLGYGDLGCYGQEWIRTPNLDRLAAEGMRFTQCYAGSTVCAPSRSCLMTGQHTGHTWVRGNDRVPLRPEDVTVAEVLKAAGYATALIGKWGLGEPDTTGIPNRKGFDEFFGYLNQAHAHNPYPEFLWKNQEKYPLEGNVEGPIRGVSVKRTQFSNDLFTREALRFVERNRKGPFFLCLAYTVPHANNERTRAEGNGMEVPDLGPYVDRPWPAPQKAYAAMITRMDADIGRLVTRLKDLGIDERTVIFFSSDNGPHQEGGGDSRLFRSAGPLRGIKRDLYEGGIRVPMIVRWPGMIRGGVTSDQVWAFWDLLPTAAELAGGTIPKGIDGISVAPTLLGPEKAGRPQQAHDFLYWEFHERDMQQAVRTGDWKAIRPGPGEPLKLYDLKTDLGETKNVATDHPDVIAGIERYLTTARTASPAWPGGKRP